MSVIRQVRDDLREAIAALPYVTTSGAAVTAVWVPNVERITEGPLRLIVAPSERVATAEGRGVTSNTLTCDVGIMGALVAGQEDDQAEELQLMCDALIDGILTKVVGNRRCVSAEQMMVVSVDHWRTLRMVASFVQFTLR